MSLYRAWLHLYPASFRSGYGDEMCAIFARKRRNTSGRLAWFALWMSTFFEIAFNAAAVHAEILRQYLGYTARALGRSPGYSPKDLVARSSQDPLRLVPAIRHIVASCDPQQPVSNVSGCFETSWKRRPRRVPFRCACLALSSPWHCWSRPLGSTACASRSAASASS